MKWADLQRKIMFLTTHPIGDGVVGVKYKKISLGIA